MSAQLLDDDGNVIKDNSKPKSNPQLMDDNGNVIGEHPHAGLTDFLSSLDDKRKEFLSNHPTIKGVLGGMGDFGASLYNTVNTTGKNAAEHLKHGDYHGVFDDITSPLLAPINIVNNSLLTGHADLPPDEGKEQLLGAVGLPGKETLEAYRDSDYPRLAGQVISAAALAGGAHYFGGKLAGKEVKPVDTTHLTEQPLADLPKFEKPAEFRTADDVVPEEIKTEIPKPQTTPEELGYNNVLEHQGKEGELEKLPNGWEHVSKEPNVDEWGHKEGDPLGSDTLPGDFQKVETIPEEIDPEIQKNKEALNLGRVELARLKESYGPLSEEYKSAAQELEDLARSMNAKSAGSGSSSDGRQALATVSNEHQVLTKPDTIQSMTGVEDGFAQPKFEQDKLENSTGNPIPEPGMAKPEDSPKSVDDVRSDYEIQFNSTNKIMDRFESTKDISKVLTDAQDIKPRWLYGKFREFSAISKDLNKAGRKQLGQLINHGTDDAAYNQANGITPEMIDRANNAKSLLDDLHDFMVQMGVKGNKGETKLGYLSQYFPNMKRGPEGFAEQIKNIWTHYLGKENPLWKVLFDTGENPVNEGVSDSVGDMYDKGTSTDPWASFTMSRKGMNPADIEWDYNRVMPAYLESVAKIAFDGPAIQKAEGLLKQNAESMSPRLKQLVENAILNYSGYDSKPALTRNWDNLSRSVANKVANSLISFNPGVHFLHLGEIPASILPGLGVEYTTKGIRDFGMNIRSNFQEMAKLGLIQDEVKPMSFKTMNEKIDSFGYFRSYAESIVKGIAYRGSLAKFLDEGLSHPEAVRAAIKEAKDLTLTVDKSRQMQALTPESKAGAGGPISRLGGQFKGIPLKYVEQQQNFVQALIDNPKMLKPWTTTALSLLGGMGAYEFGKEVNKKFIHIESPSDLVTGATLGAFAGMMKGMIRDTEMTVTSYNKGDKQQAENYFLQSLMDGAAFLTKGGTQIRKLLPDSISKPGSTGNKGRMRLRFSDKLKP